MTHARPRRLLLGLGLGALLLTATACGSGGYVEGGYYDPGYGYEPYVGSVVVDNLSFEYALGFYLAPAFTGDFTGNLLSAPLPGGVGEYVGDFYEDAYDAEADMEFGDLIVWGDVFVPAFEDTIFEIY